MMDGSIRKKKQESRVISEESLHDELNLTKKTIDYLKEERILESQKGGYKLNFVGLISHQSKDGTVDQIIALPKYYIDYSNENKALEHIGLTIRCLEIYNKKHISEDDIFIPNVFDKESSNEFALARFFIRDYLEHGPYQYESVIESIDPSGVVDWNRTIQRTEALLTNSGPIYPEPISRRRRMVKDELITNYHRLVVRQYIERYGRLLGYSFDAEFIGQIENEQMLKEMKLRGSGSSLLWHRLSHTLNESFGRRSIRLLRNLLNTIEQEYSEPDPPPMVIGTTSFHTLWEEVCKVYLDRDKDTDDIIKKFEAPTWNTLDGKLITASGRKQLTDIAIKFGNKKKPYGVLIVDAKYYYIQNPQKGKVTTPGSPDILKQWAYRQILEGVYPQAKPNFSNVLLFPIQEEESEEQIIWPFAYVVYSQIDEKKPIIAAYCHAESVLKNYSTHAQIDSQDLSKLFKEFRELEKRLL
jgi:hypothetical protein